MGKPYIEWARYASVLVVRVAQNNYLFFVVILVKNLKCILIDASIIKDTKFNFYTVRSALI